MSTAREYYLSRLDKPHTISAFIFLHRKIADVFSVEAPAKVWAGKAEPTDQPDLVNMTRQHEGVKASLLIDQWFKNVPEAFTVFRDSDDETQGYLLSLPLDRWIRTEPPVDDPGVHRALSYLRRHAPLRGNERAIMFRAWMSRQDFQREAPLTGAVMVHAIRTYWTIPNLAYNFWVVEDPEHYAEVCEYCYFKRLNAVDFSIGKRTYGVFGHDWRIMPLLVWLEKLAAREFEGQSDELENAVPRSVRLLDREQFASAIADAFRAYHNAAKLRENPLLKTWLVRSRTGEGAGLDKNVVVARELLNEALGKLEEVPNDRKYYQVLHRRFIVGAATHEATAEGLSVSVATVRRHLQRGLELVTEILWNAELAGPR